MRRVCKTILAVRKQEILHILCVCVCVFVCLRACARVRYLRYRACKAYAPYFFFLSSVASLVVESSSYVMAQGDAREGNWTWNMWMECVASTLHTTSERGVSNITTADEHNSTASKRLNWRPRRFKWTRPFCRKTKSGFCTCAFVFQA